MFTSLYLSYPNYSKSLHVIGYLSSVSSIFLRIGGGGNLFPRSVSIPESFLLDVLLSNQTLAHWPVSFLLTGDISIQYTGLVISSKGNFCLSEQFFTQIQHDCEMYWCMCQCRNHISKNQFILESNMSGHGLLTQIQATCFHIPVR